MKERSIFRNVSQKQFGKKMKLISMKTK